MSGLDPGIHDEVHHTTDLRKAPSADQRIAGSSPAMTAERVEVAETVRKAQNKNPALRRGFVSLLASA
jgi:hypothetical protein